MRVLQILCTVFLFYSLQGSHLEPVLTQGRLQTEQSCTPDPFSIKKTDGQILTQLANTDNETVFLDRFQKLDDDCIRTLGCRLITKLMSNIVSREERDFDFKAWKVTTVAERYLQCTENAPSRTDTKVINRFFNENREVARYFLKDQHVSKLIDPSLENMVPSGEEIDNNHVTPTRPSASNEMYPYSPSPEVPRKSCARKLNFDTPVTQLEEDRELSDDSGSEPLTDGSDRMLDELESDDIGSSSDEEAKNPQVNSDAQVNNSDPQIIPDSPAPAVVVAIKEKTIVSPVSIAIMAGDTSIPAPHVLKPRKSSWGRNSILVALLALGTGYGIWHVQSRKNIQN